MQWRHLPVYLAGGLLGLPLGVYLLLHLDAIGFHAAIGGLLIAYGAYVISKRPLVLPPAGWAADAAVGFVGGVTGELMAELLDQRRLVAGELRVQLVARVPPPADVGELLAKLGSIHTEIVFESIEPTNSATLLEGPASSVRDVL